MIPVQLFYTDDRKRTRKLNRIIITHHLNKLRGCHIDGMADSNGNIGKSLYVRGT